MITQYKAADPLDPTSQAEYKLLAGGATRTWVGTEDAYNAEKNNIPNNTMICITDDDMDVVADVYSTTETKTNKVWINGKPIYRKCFSFKGTMPSFSISNIENIINVSGYVTASTGNKLPMPWSSLNGGADEIASVYLHNGEVIGVVIGFSLSTAIDSVVVIEYTKTTD